MGSDESVVTIDPTKTEAPYTKKDLDLCWHLEGHWKLVGYEPENCAKIEDCNADFMFLRYYTDWPSQHFAGFDTFLRLMDEAQPECGVIGDSAHVTFVGQTFFTDNEFYKRNREMVFYEGEGTKFKFNIEEQDILKLAKNKSGECFELWSRLEEPLKLTQKQNVQKHLDRIEAIKKEYQEKL